MFSVKSSLSFRPLLLPKYLTRLEKTIILALLAFIVVSSFVILRYNYLSTTTPVASDGGTYTEGVLTESLPALNDSITALTHIGLTRLGSDGTIQPAVAKSWQVSPDGKTYTFQLQDKYSSAQVSKYIRNQKGEWSDIQIIAPDAHSIQFILKQPYGLFFASTLHPVLPYGPFKLQNQNKTEVTLEVNKDAYHPPYLKSITFQIFSDKTKLQSALKSGKIMGTDENLDSDSLFNISKYSISIPRYNVAFINSVKLSDKNTRKSLIDGTKFEKSITINLLRPNTDSAAKFSRQLIKKWTTQNIKVNEKIAQSVTLLADEAQKKQYDVLIYGINTGYYADLYPNWHSSQIPPQGMNFSLLKNKTADRLMEEARLTLDDKIRKDKFAQAKALIDSEYLAIFQPSPPYSFYANKQIKGIKINSIIQPNDRFSFADFWYIKTKRIKK